MATKEKNESRPMTEEADFLQIKSIDHIHFYVGNATQAMYYWWKAFGFKRVAYSGLETGSREIASSHNPTHKEPVKSLALTFFRIQVVL